MRQFFKDYFRLLAFAKPFKKILVLAGLCMMFSTLFEGASLTLIAPFADRVLTNSKMVLPMELPPFLASLVEKLNSLEPKALIIQMLVAVVVIVLFKNLFIFFQKYLMKMVGESAIREVRSQLYAKFQDLSLDFYSQKRTGELIARVTNDVGFITNAISDALMNLIYQSFRIVLFAAVVIALAIHMWELLIIFVIFPLIIFPVIRIGKRIKHFSLEVQKGMADLNSLLAETIQGAYIVKVFNRENYELSRFREISQKYYKFMLKSAKREIALSPLTEFIASLGAVCVVWVAFQKISSGVLSFGTLGSFMAFLMSIVSPLKKLSNVHAVNQRAIPASNRIYDILDEQPKVEEKAGAEGITSFNEKITFENVRFAYEDQKYVLEDINLTANKGEIIALVGHSGAGKSTLVGLMPRLYDPQAGRILIDGIDISDLQLKSLRSLIAVVSQEMVLFNASVSENIAYGKEGATQAEITEAAKKAYAFDFVENLPKGFSTVIGDRGFRLSGGERQRIAIARAILKDAPILILDEATSQLDSQSEQIIREALYNLMRERTSFVIAHRLSTVQKADKIVVMERGRIAEVGTHSQLVGADSLYRKLYQLQFNV